ncbi:hypothetical protein [Rhodococcus globerulus]|uniref:hypothetical protein n=1 Tax=Rhodococcus globerulus TaxID=33008 RepID=UPI001FCFE82F|nr:hypothetical protein [Rhodococcus globerulus]
MTLASTIGACTPSGSRDKVAGDICASAGASTAGADWPAVGAGGIAVLSPDREPRYVMSKPTVTEIIIAAVANTRDLRLRTGSAELVPGSSGTGFGFIDVIRDVPLS